MPLVMYDSTDVNAIPLTSQAVIGYVGGNKSFTQYDVAKRRFPHAHVLGLAVASRYDAEGVDVEKGDVPNNLVVGWVKRQLRRGVKRPVVYTSASNVATIVKLLAQAGVMRSQYRILSAHYNYRPHICGPSTCGYPQADGTQFTNHARDRKGGTHLDESLLKDDFFGAPPKPKPAPKPPAPVIPPAPKPAPQTHNELGADDNASWLMIRDKDGSEHYEPLTLVNIVRRCVKDFGRGRKYKRIILNRGL